jgi:hypothetical protein
LKENTIKAKGINITKMLKTAYKFSCNVVHRLGSEHLIGPTAKAIHAKKKKLLRNRVTVTIPKNIFSNTINHP